MIPDHRHEDLRGRSFETQSLQAVRFDGADLRGATSRWPISTTSTASPPFATR